MMKLSDLGEDQFLERVRERVPRPGPQVKLGIGDDAAALVIPEGEQTLVSTDVMVEGVHFTRRTLPPRFVGRKAVAINVSDIAAMGGQPLAVLLSLATPMDTGVVELLEVFDGLNRASQRSWSRSGGRKSLLVARPRRAQRDRCRRDTQEEVAGQKQGSSRRRHICIGKARCVCGRSPPSQ